MGRPLRITYPGAYFGIVESGVSQSCRRVKDKTRKDKKLERKISKIADKINP